MIKEFCDICGKEITNLDTASEFKLKKLKIVGMNVGGLDLMFITNAGPIFVSLSNRNAKRRHAESYENWI